jgi:ferredoxin
MAELLCATCQEPLVLEVEPDSDFEESKAPAQVESVPDDVELSCGCHYHWYGPVSVL